MTDRSRLQPPESRRTRAQTRRAALAFALFLVTGCGRAADDVADAGPALLQPADVRILGSSRSLAVVQDLEVLPDGRVWVFNSVEPFFVGFRPDGTLLVEHGREGGGPEEFRAPRGFVTGGIDGEAWVFDAGRHSLVRVSRPDSAWAEMPLPRDSMPPGSLIGGRDLTDLRVRTARLGDEILMARTTGSLDAGVHAFWKAIWGADLLALDTRSGSVRAVISLADVLGDPAARLGPPVRFPPLPLWFRLWAVCADRVRVYDRLRMEVHSFTADGTEREATPLPAVPLDRVTHRQFARAVLGLLMAERLGTVGGVVSAADSARLLNEVLARAEGEPEQLAIYLPRYVDLRCADDGTLWLRPFDIDAGGLGGGPAWFRVQADGSADEIRLPDRFDAFRFTAYRIWGVQRDEFDVASVAWIEVPRQR